MSEITKSRIADVKALAKELDADYYYGISKVKDRFNIEDRYEYKGISDSNVIVGQREEYDYCFIEYFQTKASAGGWKSKVFLRMKNNMPDFVLMTKETAKSRFLFVGIISMGFILFPGTVLLTVLFGEGRNSNIIPAVAAISLFVLAGLCLLIFIIKYLIKFFNQDKYRILNKKFKDKYVIFSDAPSEKIRTIFNEKVCSKIIKKPSDLYIDLRNNCLSLSFEAREKLSLDGCNKYLNQIIDNVKVFENDDLI